MKYLESSFKEYINEVKSHNLHSYINNDKEKIENTIFYGPSGIGKYSQALKYISNFSESSLKYEKRIHIEYKPKENYPIKISDIHYEIDMSMLGCNPKTIFVSLYQHIKDIIFAKEKKIGIILCKNFANINNEALEILYSYMNRNNTNIKFIIITNQISFIPNEIINFCNIIKMSRPTKTEYGKIIKPYKLTKKTHLDMITNIKDLKVGNKILINPNKKICDKIINKIIEYKKIKLLDLRNDLYDILIYNLDIYEAIWYIITELYNKKKIEYEQLSDLNKKVYEFSKLYNNNYRPIVHLEKITLYISTLIIENDN